MSWSLKFEPIPLAKGKPLRTRHEAGNDVAALSKKEAALPHWQVAASCLLTAVEKGGGLVMMARIAMVRALSHGKEVPEPRRKAAKRYKIVN